jgi:membrane-associated phospholipid phosphatase
MAIRAHPPLQSGELRLSRRSLVGAGLGAASLGRLGVAASPKDAAAITSTTPSPPGSWKTWLLDSGDELRPSPPPNPTAAEIAELLTRQRQRTAQDLQTVEAWGTGPAVLPWTNLALDLIQSHPQSPVRVGRALALLHAALADVAIAVADAQAAIARPSPQAVIPELTPLASDVATGSSFPSEHAAVAAAASAVLAYLFPDEPSAGLAKLATEAAESRVTAGANFRGDLDAGKALGAAIGNLAIARGKADGSDAAWDGSGRPAGAGYWQPTPPAYVQQPLDPLAGAWQTWVIPAGNAYRPPAPPAAGSPAWQAELGAIREAVARRTSDQEAVVNFWAGGPGTVTPAGLWIQIARDLIVRDGLDLPHAARVLALVSIAVADGFACCWDAKYAYWSERPITADPTLAVLIATPPFPSYTSGHATISTAAATVLAHLFPADAADLAAKAQQAAATRLWAGIHFAIDNEMGATGGGMVGRLVAERARNDGAESDEATN